MPDLETREQLRDVLALFTVRIDAADYEGCAAVFTEDCVTDYGPRAGGPITGREALRERLIASQGRFRRTHHQLGQTLFAPYGGEMLTITYVTASHIHHDGTPYFSRLQYHDRWEHAPAGWKIASRRALFGVLFDPGDLTEPASDQVSWVPRTGHAPA